MSTFDLDKLFSLPPASTQKDWEHSSSFKLLLLSYSLRFVSAAVVAVDGRGALSMLLG